MDPTDQELAAYLDEMLAAERSAAIERLLRDREDLRQRAALLARRRDQGGHTVGEIWRRQQLSCPDRQQLSAYLAGSADILRIEYIHFHVTMIGCRICQANLDDLKRNAAPDGTITQSRRRRFYESSAGLLQTSDQAPSRPARG